MKKILFLVAIFVTLGWFDLQAKVQRRVEITTDNGVTATNMVAYTTSQPFQVVIQPETFADIAIAGLQYPPMLALVLASIAISVYALIVLPRRIDRWWNSWHLHRHNDRQHKFA